MRRLLALAAVSLVAIAAPARAEPVCEAVYKIIIAGAENPRFRSIYKDEKDNEAVGLVRIGGLQDCTVSTLSFSPVYMCSSKTPIPAASIGPLKAELDRRLTACFGMPGQLNYEYTGPEQTMWKVSVPGVNPKVSTSIRDGYLDLIVRVDPKR